jgi:Icc-related predicted phosphoesterase
MRVHVISDVHGRTEGLARAGEGADAVILLGDLVDYVDYADPGAGILGRALGPQVSAEFGRLRVHGGPGELVAYIRAEWERVADPDGLVEGAVREQYDRIFGALTAPAWVIPGNVDVPALFRAYERPGLCLPDGKVVEIGGLRFGFVGGVPLPPGMSARRGGPWTPHLVPAGDYAAAVGALGQVDVLCSHAPPAVPDLAYDVVSRRSESAAPALLDVIRRDRPRVSVFGHVHQPLAARMRVGRTECVNVGHFRKTGTPYVLQW